MKSLIFYLADDWLNPAIIIVPSVLSLPLLIGAIMVFKYLPHMMKPKSPTPKRILVTPKI